MESQKKTYLKVCCMFLFLTLVLNLATKSVFKGEAVGGQIRVFKEWLSFAQHPFD